MNRLPAHATWLPALAAIQLLAGCVDAPVGDGSMPIELALAGLDGPASVSLHECNPKALSAALIFSDGSSGNFSSRAVWTSSDPGIVEVSNGDIANPAVNDFYAAGMLVPRAPGKATVRATYLDFEVQALVEVRPLFSMRIAPETEVLGVGTEMDFQLLVKLESDSEESEPGNQRWSLDAPDGTIDLARNSGTATGVATGTAQTLRGGLADCDRQATHQIRAAPITSISAHYVDDQGRDLTTGFTDAVQIWGHFADEAIAAQNLSSQVTASADSNEILVVSGDENLFVQGLQEGDEATASVEFAPNELALSLGPYSVTDRQLDRIELSPEQGVLVSDGSLQLTVTGHFLDGHQTEITRHVNWVIDQPTLASIASSFDAAGELEASGHFDAYLTVTAYRQDAVSQTTADSEVRIISAYPEH